MSSKKVAKLTRRGPKTAEGRLAVRLNASTHGILSPQPIVNAYEPSTNSRRSNLASAERLPP
jgi:hypothetical protein